MFRVGDLRAGHTHEMTTSEERYVSLPSLIPSESPNRGIGEILVDTEDSRNRQETKIPPHPSEFVVIYASSLILPSRDLKNPYPARSKKPNQKTQNRTTKIIPGSEGSALTNRIEGNDWNIISKYTNFGEMCYCMVETAKRSNLQS